ncbi:MAG: winged helix-turn-helix domain-containing protein [Spirochaetaceae bacterium]
MRSSEPQSSTLDPPSAVLVSDSASERARFRIHLRDLRACTFETVSTLREIDSADIVVIPSRMLRRVLHAAPEIPGAVSLFVFGPAPELPAAYVAGARDFMKEPWDMGELQFRLAELARRIHTPIHGPAGTLGPASLTLEGTEIPLSRQDARLLRVFWNAPDGIATRRALAFALGVDASGSSRAVDMRIARLRRRLQRGFAYDNPIVPVRGRGYRLNCDVSHGCG